MQQKQRDPSLASHSSESKFCLLLSADSKLLENYLKMLMWTKNASRFTVCGHGQEGWGNISEYLSLLSVIISVCF